MKLKELGLLLEVGKLIAQVKDKQELLKLMIAELKPVFQFEDIGLFIVNEQEDYHVDWAMMMPEISPSELNYALNQIEVQKVSHGGSLIEWMIRQLEEKQEAILFDLKEMATRFPDYPQSEILLKLGYKDCLAVLLRVRGETLGMFCVNSLNKNFFKIAQFPLLQAIADQMAVTVGNILDRERMLEEKQFKETLLSISEAVVTIQDSKQLFQVLFGKIRNVFPFDESGLFILTSDGLHHYELTDEEILKRSVAQGLIEETLGKNNIYDHPDSSVAWLIEHGPVIISLAELDAVARHPQHIYMMEAGLVEVIGGPLKSGNAVYGMICFTSSKIGRFQKRDLRLFQSIADQMAVAVSNVIANEQLLEEKQKTEQLLEVTEAIANINSGPELVRAIFDRLQQVFPFDEAGLFHLDFENQRERDLVVDYVYDISSTSIALKEAGVSGWLPLSGPSKHIVAYGPLITDVQELFDLYDHPQNDVVKQVPFQQIIAGPLVKGKETIGVLYLWTKTRGSFDPQISIFKSICDQLSVALANVIANEQLLEEKQFKETLLGISEAIASIQDRRELFSIIIDRIHPLIPFDDIGVFHMDASGSFHRDLAVTDELFIERSSSNKDLLSHKLGGYIPQHESVEIFMSEGPIILSFKELVEKFPGHPFFPDMEKAGIKEIMGGPLVYQEQKIGMLAFNSLERGRFNESFFSLFLTIAEQLAIAVNNVIANEQLIEEKQFKETLLNITASIANINTGEELIRAVFDKLKTVFPFDDAGLFTLDFDKQQERDLMVDYTLDYTGANQNLHEAGLSGWLPISEPTQYIVERDEVAVLTAKEFIQKFNHPHLAIIELTSFKEVIFGPLKQGEKTTGILCFWSRKNDRFTDRDVVLFKSISDQLSLTLNNVLANEALQRSEREEALKVQLIDALNTKGKWEDKLLQATKVMRTHFPFQLISYMLAKPSSSSPSLFVEAVGPDEYRVISTDQFLKMARISRKKLEEQLEKDSLHPPVLLAAKDLTEKPLANPLTLGFHNYFGVRQILVYPMAMSEDQYIKVACYSRNEKAFNEEHLAILSRIAPSLTLAIDRQINYFETLRLNEFIAQENEYLQEEIQLNYNFGEIVGSSAIMEGVFTKVLQVANTPTTVLLTGETGTGKELIARALHNHSNRRDKNFIKLNCAALPTELIESELFGHEKGAFTGALQKRIGKFELADEGTIFLDEIGEMPLEVQSKLLRVIQEKEFERLGSNTTIKTNARIIAATNRDLPKEVADGRFRSDLYFRLNVFPIHLPPLRERTEDILEMVSHFISKYNGRLKKRVKKLSESSLKAFSSYSWPGNVRELEHVIERAMITASTTTLDIHLEIPNVQIMDSNIEDGNAMSPLKTYEQGEIELIMNTLRFTSGKISGPGGAAEILQLKPTTLESKMKRFGITRKHVVNGVKE